MKTGEVIQKVKRQLGALSRKRRVSALRTLSVADRVAVIGHRFIVGGIDAYHWFAIGKLQFDFLVSRGLRPEHSFLDVACGALRLGQFVIPYLQTGNYHGLEGEEVLVQAGLEKELAAELVAVKQPGFTVNFEFGLPDAVTFDFAIAQSLFTHLVEEDIVKCFTNLRAHAAKDAQFFFTYANGDSRKNPKRASDANIDWRYSFEELAEMAAKGGWAAEDIGDWNHPRGQLMAVARPA